jgi:2-oxo-4-hydroxy-4-carboxy-5-ureidoimidazoline decarboxylase
MTLEELNALDGQSAARELRRCCGSTRWTESMVRARPFPSAEAMADIGDAVWTSLDASDWLEAFAAHPRIGETESGRSGAGGAGGSGGSSGLGRSAGSGGSGESGWAEQEQSGARAASKDARKRLAAGNHQYEARFGYIFIVCATGKTVEEMLRILEDRLQNDPGEELRIAAEEQRKITRLRLGRLLEGTRVATT